MFCTGLTPPLVTLRGGGGGRIGHDPVMMGRPREGGECGLRPLRAEEAAVSPLRRWAGGSSVSECVAI